MVGVVNARTRLLDYLENNPTWHYGLDLVKAARISRSTIYIHLASMEEEGVVDRREGPAGPAGIPRPQYRISRSRGVPAGKLCYG